MNKTVYPAAVLLCALSTPAAAVLLDCDINSDGTYTCIEIKGTTVSPEARQQARDRQKAYVEQARGECEYREPRKHPGIKGQSGAHRMEELKRAREKYERCVAERANVLRKEAQEKGRSQ
ncbi:MAG TPA: hypothetical protein ENK05_14190 [Gammaproteobacteria bacterium]|nr:hypothetical protein [Gammaproteobacteria bacterium]